MSRDPAARTPRPERPRRAAAGDPGSDARPGRYPYLVLLVLVLVYILNFVDRQVLAILAEEIKADLQISDADLGFLFGAAFSVFYAVMGLPLARLADLWNRKKLITWGLGFWSLMTVASGFAGSFLTLAVCRFGVGAGESSATPAAYSMLYDYFPARMRTTVLGIYSSGIYLGQGVGLLVGGVLLAAWLQAYPEQGPFGLKAWQMVFVAVGLPGLLLAGVVYGLREPVRGRLDGMVAKPHPAPFRETARLLAAMLPPISLWMLLRAAPPARPLLINLAAAAALALGMTGLIAVTGDLVQWVALGIGGYALVCWLQNLARNDRVCFGLLFGNPTLLLTIGGTVAANFMINGYGFWSIPFYQRRFAVDPATVGLVIGAVTAGVGLLGVASGGYVADRLRRRLRSGKLLVLLICLIGTTAGGALLLAGPSAGAAYVGSAVYIYFAAAAAGPAVSTINDLVLPRIRASASAFAFVLIYLVAGAIGPYSIGKLSDVFVVTSGDPGVALRDAMAVSLAIPVLGIGMVLWAMTRIGRDEPGLKRRALDLGEPAETLGELA